MRSVIFGTTSPKITDLVEEGMLDGALIDQRTISWDVAVWVKYTAKRYNDGLLEWDVWARIEIGSRRLTITLPFDHKAGSPESHYGVLPEINKPPIQGVRLPLRRTLCYRIFTVLLSCLYVIPPQLLSNKSVRFLFPFLTYHHKGTALPLQYGVQEGQGRLELPCREHRGECPGSPMPTRAWQ